jgi:prephenate dehydratase
MKTIGYLGPIGSFTYIALQRFLNLQERDVFSSISYSNFFELFDALESEILTHIIIPIENSLGGEVASSLDGLLKLPESFFISDEVILPIEQSLLAKTALNPRDIKTLYTHPQSYNQCANYIKKQCREALFVACSSNSEAAIKVSQCDVNENAAVIAHKSVGDLYGLILLQEGIGDTDDNTTRFVVLSKERHSQTGADKSSFIFSTPKDVPGSLCDVLYELSKRQINLTRITSRPTKRLLGEYVFFIDCEGHYEGQLKTCLDTIKERSAYFRFLGSYQKGD